MRPVDADEVIDTINYYFENTQNAWRMHSAEFVDGMKDGYARARSIVLKTPTVDTIKHGQWKPFDLTWGRSIYYCTSCGDGCEVPTEMEKPIYEFCPNCGAKMDEVEQDEID